MPREMTITKDRQMIKDRIFENLASAIRESGLTPGEIAERCGTKRPNIDNLTGGSNLPSVVMLVLICTAMGIESSEILPSSKELAREKVRRMREEADALEASLEASPSSHKEELKGKK
jgi:transcriptional regulator with XRE-family HTH domain